jgi:hypothetical protein
MKLLGRYLSAPVLFALLSLSNHSQAMTVASGFATGPGLFDSGEITLDPGDYTLDLEAFTFGLAGPFIFGISNLVETFQVSVATFGGASSPFTTVGGTFDYLVGGFAGAGAIFKASISPVAPVPLPPAVLLLGTALAAVVGIGPRVRRSSTKT